MEKIIKVLKIRMEEIRIIERFEKNNGTYLAGKYNAYEEALALIEDYNRKQGR